ncbi:hypothetical protein N5D61_12210 [Pseudomonas sp. GD03842]|uniref:DUF2231 domain-containing protein n=1 Tax=unclassified Pseudomonas TaxID=196821 RepID=UPI000D35FFAC|nr:MULTISPECIES: DUF2231 domain-containing protein [unclassified Pseudomonas]MDH0747107.1 hypothetical protein [Pseudomonas sp. GD03842]RAU44574.1 hypothetical protein DBP26_016055 [Pseudomonas sp. RIT 409]RAU54989.1 hypothetical protein DBY65_007705 [Pseudomonas sp. RIT 412]
MTDTALLPYRRLPGPLHSILLGGTVALFLGAVLSDIAYYNTYLIQWSNFAAWLIAGGMLLGGLALLFALINLLRATPKSGQPMTYFLVLLATWALGWINAFEHAKDAWAVMPTGLMLSVVVAVLAAASAWIGFSRPNAVATRVGGAQ